MKNEFVPYELALAMKELGFKKKCFKFYWADEVLYAGVGEFKNKETDLSDEKVSAPLYQQAFRWFREEFGIDVCIIPKFGDNGYGAECFKNGSLLPIELLGNKYAYEEAQDSCLRKLIEIVKEKL